MHWWWLGLSLIGGVVLFLADLYRAQAKKGEPWLGKNWRVTLAFYVPMGAVSGWFMFYYGPPVLYRGVVAFIHLYNDPSAPLLKLVPGWVALMAAFAVMYGASKAWRGGRMARNAGLYRKSFWKLLLALCLWVGSATLIVVGFYVTIRLR
ncbi:hypothetical protein [Allomesorhizobium camelthorni]|uniref:Uncharacterized protein n=1 Tax=Allomesorhizobium camelthorni TaxID=475069 RepID=A0A6G4WGD1_9HYPH|nr:hypothetical protein [Mesorhizobium camelthorni]NGO53253.1 hypothetical protein [Mesorhizobium camelthorni]